MTIDEKSSAIIRKIIEFANKDQPVTISEDGYSPFACTIAIGDRHTHVGMTEDDGSFENLINGLYNALYGGTGLSFAEGKD